MKQILIILIIFNCCLVYGQQLLTPFTGTLSATAQQTLQSYQADVNLVYIGLYKLDATPFYGNIVDINFGSQSFQFFLDTKGEIAMRKFWEGTSVLGDGVSSIYRGSNAYVEIHTSNEEFYKVFELENKVHAVFEEVSTSSILNGDCVDDISPDSSEIDKSNSSEYYCPLRIGIGITENLFDERTQEDITSTIAARVRQSNNIYLASRTPGLHDGISVELAYIRRFPEYTEVKSSEDSTKKRWRIVSEFSTGLFGLGSNNITRDEFDADFCGLLFTNRGTGDVRGGIAQSIGASPTTAFFAMEYRSMDRRVFTFTHEIGHLFGCLHNQAELPFFMHFYKSKGYLEPSQGWRTVMSYNWESCCRRIGFHSNPNLRTGIIRNPPHPNLVHWSLPLLPPLPSPDVGSPMGTNNAYCIDGIAKNYISKINMKVTPVSKLGMFIRTDNPPTGITNQSAFDYLTIYADILVRNEITFSSITRITDNFERSIRAGTFVDINSNNNNAFEFDAQEGSTVDIRIFDFVENPMDCEPLTDRDKSNVFDDEKAEEENNEFKVYPNPSNSIINIKYKVELTQNVNLWITDATGQTIKIIHYDEKMKKGNYEEVVDITELSNGVYFVNVFVNNHKMVKKLLVIK